MLRKSSAALLLFGVLSAVAAAQTSFSLTGLTASATVAESIFVAAPSLPSTAAVTYYLDDRSMTTETQRPFWLGGQFSGKARGYNLTTVLPGAHRLRATAKLASGATIASNTIQLTLIPSLNARLSGGLSAYANQSSAQTSSFAGIFAATSTPKAVLTSGEQNTRSSVLAMYLNWGIDPSIDSANDVSEALLALNPKGWAPSHADAATAPLSMLFSTDAPFYQAIPSLWPRVALPASYFKVLQLNTTQGGDGIGYGETVARPSDPDLTVHSQWYGNASTLRVFPYRMHRDWFVGLPTQLSGDMHMIFVDPAAGTFVSSYMTTFNPLTGGPNSLAANFPAPLGTLGDCCGSIASGFADLPVLLQPGEATNPTQAIQHALGGSVLRVWAARVYPANARDENVLSSVNSCTHSGFTNTGLVPYGGVIQLDPAVNLASLKLTLPALRILQAIQTYGYYVMDFGCADLDIYTAISETELEPYGGLWGYNRRGIGVQNEVRNVLFANKLYVVAPLNKKQ